MTNLADSEAVTSALILSTVAFDASAIGDPDGTRTVIAIVALLVVMGLALIMVAFWMRRVTRPDPEFLTPLELMGERSWRNGDPVWQRRRLDEVRPGKAAPLKRSAAPPRLDESFDDVPTATGFDDLRSDDGGPEPDRDQGEVPPGSTTPAELPVLDASDATQPRSSPAWPTAPPAVLDASDATDADGDPTPTTVASEFPADDISDREIDPIDLRRAMDELDEELRQRRGDSD